LAVDRGRLTRGVPHAFWTDRHGGVSVPPYDTANLATHVGDAPEAVRQNRDQLARTHRLKIFQLNDTVRGDAAKPQRFGLELRADPGRDDKHVRVARARVQKCQPRQPVEHPVADIGALDVVGDRHDDAVDVRRLGDAIAQPVRMKVDEPAVVRAVVADHRPAVGGDDHRRVEEVTEVAVGDRQHIEVG